MGIQKLKQLTADATVCGQTREVSWDCVEGIFAIVGVHSFPEAMEILERLAEGGVASLGLPTADTAEQETKAAAAAGTIPLAQPTTRPTPAGEEKPKFDLGAKTDDPAAERARAHAIVQREVKAAATPKAQAAPASAAPAGTTTSTPETVGQVDADLAAFANMNKLAEVVEELRKRGHNTYEAIFAYCKKMLEIGDVCPPVDQLGARLEERLKNHLASKGIAVPL